MTGTAQFQGQLWGRQARNYAEIIEPMFRPVYERVFAETEIGIGTRLLDVGCGPGLAAQIAATRGAWVSGLDAAEESLIIARQRTLQGDFHAGEMELLPWPDHTFDVVTSFNAFQFAADPIRALREARRVAKPGGVVAMVVWGKNADCETMVSVSAVVRLISQPQEMRGTTSSAPVQIEALLEQAGLRLRSSSDVECVFEFPDLSTAVRGLTSAGVMVSVGQKVGDAAVQQAVTESLAPFRTRDGGYRQRNRFHYAIGLA